ncbi:glycoside hydrolase family 25 protein, partial [bacterium]|nr:glycoside hydrolase family 25 protein [bacterium]
MKKNKISQVVNFGIEIIFIFLLICFSFHGQALSQERVKGIDLASWQEGHIDWSKLRQEGYKFVFTKATEGFIEGSYWARPGVKENVKEALNAGMLVSIWHFARPVVNRYNAKDEAESFVKFFNELLNELSFEDKKKFLRPALDIEDIKDNEGHCIECPGQNLGKKELSDWIHEWMDTVENLIGVEPIIYVNSGYAKNYLEDSVAQYNLWIAHWTNNPDVSPDIGIWKKMGKDWDFWQWIGETIIEGVQRTVDLDLFNGGEFKLKDFTMEIPPGVDVVLVIDRSGSMDYSYDPSVGGWYYDPAKMQNTKNSAKMFV